MNMIDLIITAVVLIVAIQVIGVAITLLVGE